MQYPRDPAKSPETHGPFQLCTPVNFIPVAEPLPKYVAAWAEPTGTYPIPEQSTCRLADITPCSLQQALGARPRTSGIQPPSRDTRTLLRTSQWPATSDYLVQPAGSHNTCGRRKRSPKPGNWGQSPTRTKQGPDVPPPGTKHRYRLASNRQTQYGKLGHII